MRISTSWMQQAAVSTMLNGQGDMADTQNQLNTGKRINQPSDDPVGAARALELSHMTADSAQYQRNIASANARLGIEDQSLSSSTDVLNRVRTLVLQGSNGSQTDQTRGDIATELTQLRQQLLGLANAKDGQGDYLYAGNQTGTEPFAWQNNAVSYLGDNGQRMVAAGPGMQVATGDPGSAVFMRVPTGNGTFAVQAAGGNTGTAVAGSSNVTDRTAWDGGSYTIAFTAANTYAVHDASGATISGGSYDPSAGGNISFRGVQVAMSGTPAVGDNFAVAPSGQQDIFTTMTNIIGALRTPGGGSAMQNSLNTQFSNLDQSIDTLSQTRAGIGARMNALDQQSALNGDLSLQYKTALSDVQDLDYYDAISRLSLQSTTLQAAQMTFSKVQQSSLFSYLR
ncbi:flagellar hook-associated protein FlgL [Dyella tabacisoli]|uniref:Flagellar hook-associated protein 3 n=1 Tax=Dyella tabacisoli TaxID=2282381 RepID=A0A369UGA9_9GAMM|nr:flagellar hook-associated protein FlgL [Dyella tabacisoli]RDD79764.1 flagellar hook-associated protein 3 [Dyella tabacisoli]